MPDTASTPEKPEPGAKILLRALTELRCEHQDHARGDYDFDSRCIGLIDVALAEYTERARTDNA